MFRSVNITEGEKFPAAPLGCCDSKWRPEFFAVLAIHPGHCPYQEGSRDCTAPAVAVSSSGA